MIDAPRPERWEAIKAAINPPLAGQTLVDLGCHDGAFVGAASAEGMVAHGVDRDRDIIELARRQWPQGAFQCRDFYNQTAFGGADLVLMLSSWAYVVEEHGAARAELLLHDVVDDVGCLFFETQLRGDGPGPWFLENDEDVARMLARYGEAEPIITLPVEGRESSRTVWKVWFTPSA